MAKAFKNLESLVYLSYFLENYPIEERSKKVFKFSGSVLLRIFTTKIRLHCRIHFSNNYAEKWDREQL